VARFDPRLCAAALSVDEIDHPVFFEFVNCRSFRQPRHTLKITNSEGALAPYHSKNPIQFVCHGMTSHESFLGKIPDRPKRGARFQDALNFIRIFPTFFPARARASCPDRSVS
jgi:hypothetical protein